MGRHGFLLPGERQHRLVRSTYCNLDVGFEGGYLCWKAKKLIKSTIVADLRVSGEIGKKRDGKYAGLNNMRESLPYMLV